MNAPLSYCLVLLKKRLRSRYELDQVMNRRGVSPDERRAVLEELEENNLVNDKRFAEAWVHTRDLLAPRGSALLRAELMKKGIDKEVINTVLAERSEQLGQEDYPDEVALAREMIRKKSRYYASLDPEVRKRRVMGILERRGFSYDVIRKAMEAPED